jgi:hypothetical protein
MLNYTGGETNILSFQQLPQDIFRRFKRARNDSCTGILYDGYKTDNPPFVELPVLGLTS